ncbi:NAD-dependent epimerase/dehydratase family protein [Dehalococcoidia bacterium]|nr:NAD-dependent epimerase/dehydratase family protein [Dehalococcoidia bacterium]
MHITITGGHGFIGQHLTRRLCEQGHKVFVLDLYARPASIKDLSYNYQIGDVLDPEWLQSVWPDSTDVVFHLIGLADALESQKDPSRSFSLNVLSTERILEVCRANPVKRFVALSTAAIYGKISILPVDENTPAAPTSIYGWHKHLVEILVQAYGRCYKVPFTILRLFNVYGRGHKGIISLALTHARNSTQLNLFGADQLRDFIYVGDVVEALTRVAESPEASNRIMNIGSGDGLSVRDAVEMVRVLYPSLLISYNDADEANLYDSIADINQAQLLLKWSPSNSRLKIPETIRTEMLEE